jgi:hypothetical protein
MTLEYHSAIYEINPNEEIATRITFDGYNYTLLPTQVKLKDLANLLSEMQKVCFKHENKKNSNANRIKKLFIGKDIDKTIIVAISLGYSKDATDYMDFKDGGSATVQLAKYEFISSQQPWINEVCRSKIHSKIDTSDTSITLGEPVKIVMELIENYIKYYLMKQSKTVHGLYLYVEKEQPKDKSVDFLIKYYKKYGFKKIDYQDDEYYYMYKKIINTPSEMPYNGNLKRVNSDSILSSNVTSKKSKKNLVTLSNNDTTISNNDTTLSNNDTTISNNDSLLKNGGKKKVKKTLKKNKKIKKTLKSIKFSNYK